MRRARRSADRTRGALVAVLLLLSLGGALPAQPPDHYKGMPLTEALARLQAEGLRIIYSSDLVHPEMKVTTEPTATWLHDILEQVLAPHGLAVRVGPGGNLLVVRAGPPPVTVRITTPVEGEVTTGEIEVAAEVTTTEPVSFVDFFVNGWPAARVRQAPWHAQVAVPDEGGACRFTVVARTASGARATDSVVTKRIVLEARVEVALRQIFVTVDRRGNAAAVGPGDFRLYEHGVLQPLATFGRGDAPLSVLILIDASESMGGKELEEAFDAARAFLRTLAPVDEAAVMLFSDRLLSLTPFGPPEIGLLEGVEGAVASGGTALDDHLYAALRLLDDRPGRRVVVLLSDGADVTSSLTSADLQWKVQRSDAAIYWLQLRRPGGATGFSSSWRDAEANEREAKGLADVVEASGGGIRPLSGDVDLSAAFHSVVGQLREQYVLGYYPKDLRKDGSWRAVEVRGTPGLRLRYRAGWVDR